MMINIFSANGMKPELKAIAKKVQDNRRINNEECIFLYKNADLGYLGILANFIRQEKHGDITYFNKNFHVEPTNVCVYSCAFCAYSRKIKMRDEGWEFTEDDIMDIVQRYDNQPVTEVHFTGGVLPQYDLDFYVSIFKKIKNHRPHLHIKALTPVELTYIFKKAGVDYRRGLEILKKAGMDSMPGGGAEIFDEKIREKIAGGKCSTTEWLDIHEEWHNLGGKSNATMLYGHIENFEHRVDHLDKLRKLQDKTGGFQAFIPLKFRNGDNEMSNVPEVNVIEDLRNYAISRIYLDNFEHIKAYWPMISREIAQMSLAFGVNDIDGTIDDTTKIYSLAGAEEQNPAMTTGEIIALIEDVGRKPVERDTLYGEVQQKQSS